MWSEKAGGKEKKGVKITGATKYIVSKLRSSGIRRDYELEEDQRLGTGRFGEVMRGWRKDSHEEVAVKKLSKAGKSQRAVEKMRREIEIMKRVRHQHCVRMHAVYESSNNIYIVMDMMRGGDLLKRVIEKDCHSEMEAAKVFCQLISGIKYLHSIGIVHRDIKPDNILYVSADENASIKICDYGLSKLLSAKELGAGRPRLVSRCGTPNFVAPEVYSGEQYGAEVDLWSAGVILYALLCGFLPFEQDEARGENGETLLVPRISAGVDFPSPYWDAISEGAKDLIQTLLRVNPATRATVAEVQAHAWVQGMGGGEVGAERMPGMQQQRAEQTEGAGEARQALRQRREEQGRGGAGGEGHEAREGEAGGRLAAGRRGSGREGAQGGTLEELDADGSGAITAGDLREVTEALALKAEAGELKERGEGLGVLGTGAGVSCGAFRVMMGAPSGEGGGQSGPSVASTAEASEPEWSQEGGSDSDSVAGSLGAGHSSGETVEDEVQAELRAALAALDADGTGVVDVESVRGVLARLGLAEAEAGEVLRAAEVRGRGVVEAEEAVAVLCRPHRMRAGSA